MMQPAIREYQARVAGLHCIVCRNENLAIDSPAEIRYIDRRAAGRRTGPRDVIPLCHIHHRKGDGSERYKRQIAVRKNLHVFERLYGTETELLQQTLIEVDMP